jgi:hypothetical protein
VQKKAMEKKFFNMHLSIGKKVTERASSVSSETRSAHSDIV